MNILVIYGSLREKSINKALARNAQSFAPEGVMLDLVGVGDIPLFNEDLELTAFPDTVETLKNKIKAADGILIVTPEYNRSMSGSLKNAIDWTSRPDKDSAWTAGKPVGVIGASNGMRGASFAQYDVKRIMMYFNMALLGQPEFYLALSDKNMDAEGNITDEKTKETLKKYLVAFTSHVQRNAR